MKTFLLSILALAALASAAHAQASLKTGSINANGSITASGAITQSGTQRVFSVPGTGLSSSGATVSLAINGGATQTCPGGQAVTAVTAAGIVTCSVAGGLSGLTTNHVLKAGSSTTAVDAWPIDDGTTFGIANKFTITEASGDFHSFGTGQIDGNYTLGDAIGDVGNLHGATTTVGIDANAGATTALIVKNPSNAASTTVDFALQDGTGDAFRIKSDLAGTTTKLTVSPRNTIFEIWTGSTAARAAQFDGSQGTTLDGNATLKQALITTGVISPTSLSADQNDYNPTGLSTAYVVRLASSANVSITGLTAQAHGTEIIIQNINSSAGAQITLTAEDTLSTAANRFTLPSANNWVLLPGSSVTLRYSTTTSRWVTTSSPNTNGTFFAINLLSGDTMDASDARVRAGSLFLTVAKTTGVSGTINNWNPTFSPSVAAYSIVRINTTGATTVTGFPSVSNDGRQIWFWNIGNNTLTLTNEDAGSTAANRFTTPTGASVVIPPGQMEKMFYDLTAARWEIEYNTNTQKSQTSPIYGLGTDGTVTFDGSTTVLGLAPSSNVYTMTRAIWCSSCTVNSGVEIKTAGFGFFDNGTLTLNGKITDNGAAASGSTNGGTRASGWYGATNPGGAGGGNAGAASTTSLCNPFVSTTSGGTAGAVGAAGGNGGACVGGGGGGASATNTGGAGGALTAPGAANCGDLIAQLQHGKNSASLGTTLTFGTGGGGGGTNGGAGGGGGASGGLTFVAAHIFAGTGTVEAAGGTGGNAASGGGGGGGGGGGFAIMAYDHNQGTVTTVVTGGTHGTGAGGGGNGGDGGGCLSFKFNLSGDGT